MILVFAGQGDKRVCNGSRWKSPNWGSRTFHVAKGVYVYKVNKGVLQEDYDNTLITSNVRMWPRP